MKALFDIEATAPAALERTCRPRTMGVNRPDDFQTPPHALEPLYGFLRPEWRIWECSAGQGQIAGELRARGWSVVDTDAKQGWTGDFLTQDPGGWDAIVTNPPYSVKDQFLVRAYQLGRPFAFLMPLTTLEGQTRQALFRRHGVEIVFMPRRVNFVTPSGKGSGSWFATAWFTWGLGIGRALTFWEPSESSPRLALDVG